MQEWIENHFNTLHQLQMNALVTDKQGKDIGLAQGFEKCIQAFTGVRDTKAKIMFVGNGGSAGIASHLAIDFSKNGCMPAMAFSDASAITCLSNDYGYEHVFSKQIEFHARKGDVLVAISSSGKSVNITNAVEAARKIGCEVVTFSGFKPGNPLSKLGDVNYYIDSNEYGFVEVAHMGLGHTILDYIIESESANTHADQAQLVAAS